MFFCSANCFGAESMVTVFFLNVTFTGIFPSAAQAVSVPVLIIPVMTRMMQRVSVKMDLIVFFIMF